MDIPEFIQQLKAEATWQTGDRYAMTVYKTNGMRIVMIALHEDAIVMEKLLYNTEVALVA